MKLWPGIINSREVRPQSCAFEAWVEFRLSSSPNVISEAPCPQPRKAGGHFLVQNCHRSKRLEAS
jgi:hypothetical protein